MGHTGKRRSSVCWGCLEAEAHKLHEFKLKKWTTWIDPKTGRVTRRCLICKETKDLEDDFYGKTKALPGSKHKSNRVCKSCFDERIRESNRKNIERVRKRRRASSKRYIERHPDRVKARRKRYHEKVMADPEAHAKMLEYHRMNTRLRQERKGRSLGSIVPSKTARKLKEPKRRLPAPPLAAFVEQKIAERQDLASIEEVCSDLGVEPRSFRAWRDGSRELVQIGVAERVLLNADVDWEDIYKPDEFPELYEGILSDELPKCSECHEAAAYVTGLCSKCYQRKRRA